MAIRRQYVATSPTGDEYYFESSEGIPPPWFPAVGCRVAIRTTKRQTRQSAPNYSRNANSIQAAYQYQAARSTVIRNCLVHLLDARGQWVNGRTLVDLYGTDALRRVRELEETYGWPIEKRPAGKRGPWDYRMNLGQAPQAPVKVMKRSH